MFLRNRNQFASWTTQYNEGFFKTQVILYPFPLISPLSFSLPKYCQHEICNYHKKMRWWRNSISTLFSISINSHKTDKFHNVPRICQFLIVLITPIKKPKWFNYCVNFRVDHTKTRCFIYRPLCKAYILYIYVH